MTRTLEALPTRPRAAESAGNALPSPRFLFAIELHPGARQQTLKALDNNPCVHNPKGKWATFASTCENAYHASIAL